MTSSSASEAQLRSEIARLTATINQHKSGQCAAPRSRLNTYVNPNYKPPNKYIKNITPSPRPASPQVSQVPKISSTPTNEVVLGGVAFQASGHSLVRKGVLNVNSGADNTRAQPQPHQSFARKSGHVTANRLFKPKVAIHRRRPHVKHNMTLNNTIRPHQSVRAKRSDKPCPRFTTTGACSRGLTCLYQHDPSKIAICWNFLHGNCSNTTDTCSLSHEPTPERTPLCVHFLNKGRCTREKCPFPHVNVGARQGVCRDFAVLGYCSDGLDCDKQHVRECPDFAEKGSCLTKGCKLPHVIRANRNRKPPTTTMAITTPDENFTSTLATDSVSSLPHVSAEDARLGDEYISLTFRESDSSQEESGSEAGSDSEEESNPPDDVEMHEE